MSVQRLSHAAFAISAFGLLFLTGCGPAGVTVSGKVVLPPGAQLNDTDQAQISLTPTDSSGKATGAKISPTDHTFTCSDVAPGKYKLSVSLTAYPGPDQQKRQTQFDAVDQGFQTHAAQMQYEVTTDRHQSITVDPAKGVSKG